REIAWISHVALVLAKPRDAPFHVVPAGECAEQLPQQHPLAGGIASIEGILQASAHAAETVEAHDADRLAENDGACRKSCDRNEEDGDPANDVVACQGLRGELGQPETECKRCEAQQSRAEDRAPTNASPRSWCRGADLHLCHFLGIERRLLCRLRHAEERRIVGLEDPRAARSGGLTHSSQSPIRNCSARSRRTCGHTGDQTCVSPLSPEVSLGGRKRTNLTCPSRF